jgi:hypothetical protein
LPELKLETLREFTVRQAGELGNTINNDVLATILPVLSKNPRQIKLLLRYLASLESQLRRFDPDEIDLRRLYLCQMLKLEFPEEARRLANDDNLMDEIGSHSLLKRLTESKIAIERKENTYAPDEPLAKVRFLDLCKALRESGPSLSRYSLCEMFTILEQPPIITWRESNQVFEEFHAAPEDAKRAVLDSWLTQSQNFTSNSLCHLFQQIVKMRESLWSWVIEANAEDEILERLSKVSSATELLKRLLESRELFRIGGLDTSDWTELFVHLARWSKWRRPEYYLKIRNEELALLKCAAKAVTPDMKNDIFANLWKLDLHGKRDCSDEFLQEIEEIKTGFGKDLAEAVITRFSRPEGIKVYWGESSFPAEKLIAFDPRSVFHTLAYRKRLIELAALAPSDKVIHENFLVYFEILAYGATQGGSLSHSNCQTLLRDQEFTKVIWGAAVARPLNLRTVGSLRERIESLKQILDSKIETFNLPAWLQTMDDKYFASTVENKE